MEPREPWRHVYTVEQAATVLQVAPDTVYGLIRSGELPAKRVGNRLRIPRGAFHRWLDASPARQPERVAEPDYSTWPNATGDFRRRFGDDAPRRGRRG